MEDERHSSLPEKSSLCVFGLLLVLSWSAELRPGNKKHPLHVDRDLSRCLYGVDGQALSCAVNLKLPYEVSEYTR